MSFVEKYVSTTSAKVEKQLGGAWRMADMDFVVAGVIVTARKLGFKETTANSSRLSEEQLESSSPWLETLA